MRSERPRHRRELTWMRRWRGHVRHRVIAIILAIVLRALPRGVGRPFHARRTERWWRPRGLLRRKRRKRTLARCWRQRFFARCPEVPVKPLKTGATVETTGPLLGDFAAHRRRRVVEPRAKHDHAVFVFGLVLPVAGADDRHRDGIGERPGKIAHAEISAERTEAAFALHEDVSSASGICQRLRPTWPPAAANARAPAQPTPPLPFHLIVAEFSTTPDGAP